jgi:hypothetical protein
MQLKGHGRKDGTGRGGGAGWKKSNLCEYVKIMTKKLWCYDDVVPQQISKRICPEICGQTKNFYVCTLNLNFFFGFSDPANFLHQPARYVAPSNRILKKILGFQIPPIFCIAS